MKVLWISVFYTLKISQNRKSFSFFLAVIKLGSKHNLTGFGRGKQKISGRNEQIRFIKGTLQGYTDKSVKT